MGSLPADILMPILCQQHVKDLLRYKSTCKLWYSMMDDPDFINMHFDHHSVLETTSCVIVTGNTYDIRMSGDNHFFWVDDIHTPKQVVRLTNPLIGETLVLGSCNGLLALRSKRELALWNPCTGRFRKLPTSPHEQNIVYGFGHDPVHDDYKLVKLALYRYYDHCDIKVYSTKSNTWKRINHNFEICNVIATNNGVLLSNVLHWVVGEKPRDEPSYLYPSRKTIMSFDLVTEEPHKVPLPSHYEEKFVDIDVGVIGGSLGVIFNPLRKSRTAKISVWMMKEYGVKESWTKLFDVTPPSEGIHASTFCFVASLRKNDRDGVILKSMNELTWYDLEGNRAEEPVVACSQCTPFSTHMCLGSFVGLNDTSIGKLSWEQAKEDGREKRRKRMNYHTMEGLCFRKTSNSYYSFGEGSTKRGRYAK